MNVRRHEHADDAPKQSSSSQEVTLESHPMHDVRVNMAPRASPGSKTSSSVTVSLSPDVPKLDPVAAGGLVRS